LFCIIGKKYLLIFASVISHSEKNYAMVRTAIVRTWHERKKKWNRVHFAVDYNLLCGASCGDKRRRATLSFASAPVDWAFGKAHPLSAALNIHENLRLSVTGSRREGSRRIGTLSNFIWRRRPWRNVLPSLPTQRL